MGAWIKGSNKSETSETSSKIGPPITGGSGKEWHFLSRKKGEKFYKILLPYVTDKLHWENGETYLHMILSFLIVDEDYPRKKPWPGMDTDVNGKELISNRPHGRPYDFLYKVILIGDSGVGKSSLLTRYADNEFYESFIATIGVDFKIVTLYSLENLRFKIQVWDTAGPERFRTITRAYYRGANGLVIVYDMSYRPSFENVDNWFRHCFEYKNDDSRIILLANKSDKKREVSTEEGREKAEQFGAMFMEVSAKTGENVDEAFGRFVACIHENIQQPHEKPREQSPMVA